MTVRHMIAAVGVLLLVVLVLGFLSGGAGFTPGGPVVRPVDGRGWSTPPRSCGRSRRRSPSGCPPPRRAGGRTRWATDVVAGRKAVRAGYLTPSAGYLQLQQSDASEEALLAAVGERAAQGVQEVGGVRWVVYGARPAEPVWIADVKGVRLVLTGSATDDEFRTLATAVLAAWIRPPAAPRTR